MEKIINAIEKAIENENWYAALFLALTLPDICGDLEDKPQGAARYIEWFDTYLGTTYADSLTGSDCYALRCSILHEGGASIEEQRKKEILDCFIFVANGPHRTRISNSMIGAPDYDKKEILQLAVNRFCQEFIDAAKVWQKTNENNEIVSNNLSNLLIIHESGVRIGGIQFGK